MALEIDKRLLDPSSQMEIIENLNRILKLIDSASSGGGSDLETVKQDIQNLKTATAGLPTLKQDVNTAKTNITALQQSTAKIPTIDGDVTKLKSDLAALTERVTALEGAGA